MDEQTRNLKQTIFLGMDDVNKPLLKHLNSFLTCGLCGGYLVEATAVDECFHTYCKSCIVQFLGINKSCPACEIQLNKSPVYLSLRSDPIVQRLVYKMVPGLYQRELNQHRQFWMTTNVKETLNQDLVCHPDEYYFAPDEMISLVLEYIEPSTHRTNIEQSVDLMKNNGELNHWSGAVGRETHISHRRYLHCPAAMKIRDMSKFIRLKYNLKNNNEVVITLDDVKLPDYFSLMDTAYTFSWTREKPLHLCYQIFERTLVPAPVSVANKMYDNLVPTESSDYLNRTTSASNMFIGSVKSSSATGATSSGCAECNVSNNSKPNLKRKSDSVNTPTEQSDSSGGTNPKEKKNAQYRLNLREASVKIPRIEKSEMELDVKSEEPDVEIETATKLIVYATEPTTLVPMFENYTDYVQNIEEVREDNEDGLNDVNDDGNNCLCISQLSEEDTHNDEVERGNHKHLNIEILDWEYSKDGEKEYKSQDNKKGKYKRKSKKSKHHHHHKHHHRHHERKKMAPQATILHSTDTDIMKLKLKLNTVNTDMKHHKQRKYKRRKSPENYFSFSSGSSVGSIMPTSPDTTNSFSQPMDEDSSHSEISEFSLDSNDTYSSKDENNFTQTKQISPCSTPVKQHTKEEVEVKPNVITNAGEGLLQMRSFRPKCVSTARLNDGQENCAKSGTKNDDNNNDEDQKPLKKTDASAKPATSLALTVSKITAAEVEKEQQKKQLHNGHKEESPALEITVISAKAPEVMPVSVTTTVSSLVCVPLSTGTPNHSFNCKGNNVTIIPNKTAVKPIKPIPAAIPLSQYQKMQSTKQTTLSKLTEQHNFPRSLSITPHMVSDTQHLIKTNADAASKKSDLALTKIDLLKQSVTISLSENDSALDLSANKVSSAAFHNKMLNCGIQNNSQYNTCTNKAPETSTVANMTYPFQKPITYPLKIHKQPVVSMSKNYRMTFPSHHSKSQARTNSMSLNKAPSSIPLLNKMKTVHPRPNQNVRSIPDLSNILINRHHFHQQALASVSTSFADHQIKLPQNPLMTVACSLTNLKKSSDKCPASLPFPKGYVDRIGLMVTK